MIQVYPFHSTDVQEVYSKLNNFLQELAVIGVLVAQDDIRSNTKYYPEWDRTATTIEVFVGMDSLAPDSDARDQIRDLHRAAVNGKTEPEQEESADVQAARKLIEGMGLALTFSAGEGWSLTRSDGAIGVLFWGVPEKDVLRMVERQLGLVRADVPAPTGDDFDPFLDSDDLP